jgi:hypothetical protein
MAQVQFHKGNNEKDGCCNNVNVTSTVQYNDMKTIPHRQFEKCGIVSCSQPL